MAPKKAASKQMADEKTEEREGYEFGGPLLVGPLSILLPILCYAFVFLCNDVSGCPAPSLLSPSKLFTPPASPLSPQSGWQHALEVLKTETGWPGVTGLINLEAVLGTLAWYATSLALYLILPAQEVEGTQLRNGTRLKYRLNVFFSSVTIMIVCAAGTWVRGPDFQVWTFINRNFLQLLTTNILISYALATYFYLASFSVKPRDPHLRELAGGGHTGNLVYDWFIGRELNPRLHLPWLGSEVDVKVFMELRPGMLAWVMFDLAFMAQQYKSYGYVTDSMLIVVFSQTLYVFDSFYMEPAVLTTIDIIKDGFGFMLAFGDLVWLPFTYCLQARYLSVHPVMLGPWTSLAILAMQASGYYIFRSSNSEKNTFRTRPDDPAIKHLTYIENANGSRLLTSGWWSTARHINYLGDWLMSWSYCLPTLLSGYKLTPSILHPGTRLVSTEGMAGAAIPVTYFYMLYFAILLIHRQRRDDEKCKRKYGKDWEEYCQKVPSRIIPGIY